MDRTGWLLQIVGVPFLCHLAFHMGGKGSGDGGPARLFDWLDGLDWLDWPDDWLDWPQVAQIWKTHK